MKYDTIRQAAIYTFIVVSVAMTLLSVLAIWFDLDDIGWKAFVTILVIAFGSAVVAYAASLLDRNNEPESLPSFAPHPPKPVPPPKHLAHTHEEYNQHHG